MAIKRLLLAFEFKIVLIIPWNYAKKSFTRYLLHFNHYTKPLNVDLLLKPLLLAL